MAHIEHDGSEWVVFHRDGTEVFRSIYKERCERFAKGRGWLVVSRKQQGVGKGLPFVN